MEKRETQKELFEDLEKAPRRPRGRQLVLPKTVTLTIRIERLVFFGIALLMVMLIVHALGVERGKRLARVGEVKIEIEEARPVEAAEKPRPVAASIPEEEARKPQERQEAAVGPQPETRPKEVPAGQYTIQAVSLSNKTSAEAEVGRLNGEGHKAYIDKVGQYYVVCVGAFGSEKEANAALKILRKRYADCFVKRIRR